MGAFMQMCIPIAMIIATCVTSLVLRVIRLGVENFPISSMPKDSTFSKSILRSLREKLAAISAVQSPDNNVTQKLSAAHAIIFSPTLHISLTVFPPV